MTPADHLKKFEEIDREIENEGKKELEDLLASAKRSAVFKRQIALQLEDLACSLDCPDQPASQAHLTQAIHLVLKLVRGE